MSPGQTQTSIFLKILIQTAFRAIILIAFDNGNCSFMNTYKPICHVVIMIFTASSTFSVFLLSRSLPKISSHEEEGVHQNPQYTGHHHFHPVPHDHDFCERVVINVSQGHRARYQPIVFLFLYIFSSATLQHLPLFTFLLFIVQVISVGTNNL